MDELRETHISRVLLRGDRAYKLKKPLRLPFLDYGSLERRHELCREEVRLNRRLAPDVYRGVRALVPGPDGLELRDEATAGAVEYVVEMRRYDEVLDARTPARRRRGGGNGGACRRSAARRLPRGRRAPRRPRAGGARARSDAWPRTSPRCAACRGGDGAARRRRAARRRCARRAAGRAAPTGRARGSCATATATCAPSTWCSSAGIEIVDCVEFDPALREIDVGLDLAFLVMDLLRRDERLAAALVSAYREAGGDPGDDALVAFFAAQRALIRAKVALRPSGPGGGRGRCAAPGGRRRAARRLAERLGWRVRFGPVASSAGLAASGKSTLAAAARRARRRHASCRPIVVRKELLGLAADGPRARERLRVRDEPRGPTPRSGGGRASGSMPASASSSTPRSGSEPTARRSLAALGAAEPLWIECRAPVTVRAGRAAARRERPTRPPMPAPR